MRLAFSLLLLLVSIDGSVTLRAEKPVSLTVRVVDRSGASIAGADIQEASGQLLGRTDTSGQVTVSCSTPCRLRIAAKGFGDKFVEASANITVQLDPAAASQQVTVTAYRAPLASLESPVTTRTLSQPTLSTTAGFTVDAQVRQLPGVELFRRSSSLVANPTSQGVSLRGLGSTSASRTLVTEDDVPLNDAVGGWIHWNEMPELAIDRIEVLRGGASDLYGSSAIGGVLNVVPARSSASTGEVRSSYGRLGTYDTSALLEAASGKLGILASGGALGTDGFIQIAPGQRGPVDTPSNMHGQNGLVDLDYGSNPLRFFVRGSGFNEARDNGTPYQKNGTRLWRYVAGSDWQAPHNASAALRLYGSTEHYRQTFSSIQSSSLANSACTFRCGESPTRFTRVPDNELGAAAHWNQPIGPEFLIVTGADVHDVRVWDREQTFSGAGTLSNLNDRQRDSAAYAEAMWTHQAWTATASGRLDWFRNFDAHQVNWNGFAWVPAATQPPAMSENIFDPRLGISRKLGVHFAISGSAFRAFRAPTPSELYRSTQVGSKLTLPNPTLQSERATGWEFGVASEGRWGIIRTSYFDTQVNRPIVAVTLDPANPLLLKRQNLGQIESRGLSVDFEVTPQHWLALEGGYQYAHAIVSRGSQDLSNWIPEVARNMGTLNLRAFKPRLGTLSLQSRISGRQYDDDANLFPLHGYFRLDAYASHDLGAHLTLFASGENLFDRAIEVSKTPNTTLATPRLARAGLQLLFGGAR
ncbi:TonB-dependent receptor plug domain-containing protein [Occallatibacter savannae]|uniref:TonB-dependent receptor plug domain-containing protein n=1 Tax=Occallatibacter savannae TaxID=1002691 RepID=UPI0013A56495|nr:TonB-dependent receptor [Occallatibacter savannae]